MRSYLGNGNACLVKSGIPYLDDLSEAEAEHMLTVMHKLNPAANGGKRDNSKLCSGQTLLCASLGLKVVVRRRRRRSEERESG